MPAVAAVRASFHHIASSPTNAKAKRNAQIASHVVVKAAAHENSAHEQSQQEFIVSLFKKAITDGENIEQVAKDLFTELKDRPKASEGIESVKRAFLQTVVQQAMEQNSLAPLQGELFKQIASKNYSEQLIIDAIKSVKTALAKRLTREIEAISHIPFARHNLMAYEILAICLVAERELAKLANTSQPVYFRAQDLQICRSLVIDPNRKTFTILSKKHGQLHATGAFKRVTDAIEVTPANETAQARRIVRLVSKAYERISDQELAFEERYGRVLSWMHYQSKKRPGETKTQILQEAYDHDLYVFTDFPPPHLRKKISFADLLKVLSDASQTLYEMHKDGIVHRDFKAKNVLYRKSSSGLVEAKVIDYGHCYHPTKSIYGRKRLKGYGTLRYTAPDLLERRHYRADPLFLAKSEDAYALGSLIYEVYLQKGTPWGSLTYRAIKDKKNGAKCRKEAIYLQKQTAKSLAEESKRALTAHEKELYRIMSRLLDPNPFTRMRIPEFMTALHNLKMLYFKISPIRES